MTQDGKPDPVLRAEIINDKIVIVDKDDTKHMRQKTLEKTREYYEAILECLCGEQVWSILEALATVEEEIKKRRGIPEKPDDYEAIRKEFFEKLNRKLYKDGHRHSRV